MFRTVSMNFNGRCFTQAFVKHSQRADSFVDEIHCLALPGDCAQFPSVNTHHQRPEKMVQAEDNINHRPGDAPLFRYEKTITAYRPRLLYSTIVSA